MRNAVIAVNPTHRSVYISTPVAPPRTHASCRNDSDLPNAEAVDSSGRSSCMEASRQALAIALLPDVINVATAATRMLPANAVANATAVTATVDHTTNFAGWPSLSRAAVMLPMKLPMAAATPIRPSTLICSQPLLSASALATKAGYRKRNPTINLMVQLPHNAVM